ncbi:MAG: transaldolase [Vicinamibacterales bacterium]
MSSPPAARLSGHPPAPGHVPDTANPVKALQRFGQSVWLDDLSRSLLTSGELERFIVEDGLRGVTSNPTIFHKAMVGGAEYDDDIRAAVRRGRAEPVALYETLAIRDIRSAADVLRPVHDATCGGDGYASLEVSPHLAHDTMATVEEARRLWTAVDRRNLMIKVPATREGVPALRQLISEGINVNVTLIFGLERYAAVAEAYMEGISVFADRGGPPAHVSGVASFFLSRIDTAVDDLIAARLAAVSDGEARAVLTDLQGTVAIANAKLAYQRYLATCQSTRWRSLAARGARPQRLLWASTSTKNPRYRDVRYVEELIGCDTINTMTPATMSAFREHGRLRASVVADVDDAHRTMERLRQVHIPFEAVTEQLLEEGITRFSGAFDALLAGLGDAARRVSTAGQS